VYLEREFEIMSQVQHPNCVNLFELFESTHYIYLVMELINGGDLLDFIKDYGRHGVPEPEGRQIMKDLLCGLKYLHAMGIVHRDIKPENLLVESQSNIAQRRRVDSGKTPDRPLVKITDFGLAKLWTDESTWRGRAGTPAFMAPELLKNASYGPPVDLWAAGVTMYNLLSGKLPFVMPDRDEKIMSARYSVAGGSWDHISSQAKDLLRALLTVDPEKRSTADEALTHPWIRSGKFGEVTESMLASFSSLSNLCRATTELSMIEDTDDGTPRLEKLAQTCHDVHPALHQMMLKYPTAPPYERYWTDLIHGELSFVYEKQVLSTVSVYSERAMKAGFGDVFYILACVHPRVRLTIATEAGNSSFAGRVWYGDPHHEAWEVLFNSDCGLVIYMGSWFKRTVSTVTWSDALARVVGSVFKDESHLKHEASKLAKLATTDSPLSIEARFLALAIRKLCDGDLRNLAPVESKEKVILDLSRVTDEKLCKRLKLMEEAGYKDPIIHLFLVNVLSGLISRPIEDLEAWFASQRSKGFAAKVLGKRDISILFSALSEVAITRAWLISNGISIPSRSLSRSRDRRSSTLEEDEE